MYAVGEYDDGQYVLKMSYGVGAQKMTSALADALKPRCSDATLIEEFEECLLKGLPNGAPKGTQLAFSTGGGKLGVVRWPHGCSKLADRTRAAVKSLPSFSSMTDD